MTRAERWMLRIWLVALVGAFTATFLGWIVILLIFLVITAPLAFVITFTPTLLLYLSGFLLVYVPLRLFFGHTRRRRIAVAFLSILPVAVVGYAVPSFANSETDARVETIMAGDFGEEPFLAPVQSIALLVDRSLADERC